jgi:NADPH oxidase
MIHGNGLTIIPLFIYLIDLFYRLYLVKKINKLKWNVNYSILSKDIIKIDILDNKLYCHSAQYVYICIPQISLLEWHPYSIANAPNENKIIYIKVLGDWTKNLKYLIQNNEKIDIYFDGFYGNISKYLLEYQYILLIGGGLGITPILSILKHIYYNYKNNLQYIKKIHFICSFDDFQKITHLLDPLYSEYKEIFNKENIYKFNLFNTYIHITNNKNNISNNDLDIFSFKYFISQERPNIHKYITDFNMMAFNDNIKKIGIFTSGPEAMVNDVFEYANLVSKTTNIKHDIYTENYKY